MVVLTLLRSDFGFPFEKAGHVQSIPPTREPPNASHRHLDALMRYWAELGEGKSEA